MSILSKLETALWYLARPSYLPNFVHLLRTRIFGRRFEMSRAASERWCESRAVTNAEALRALFPESELFVLDDLFPAEMAFARDAERACPVAMGGPGDIDLIYSICELLDARRALETGVAYGWSSLALLLSLSKRSDHRLVSTDMSYAKLGNDPYVGCVVTPSLRSSWKIIKQPDRVGLRRAIAELQSIDICHYDSDKTYAGRMFAYPLLWEALRPGGVLISDDINDNMAFHDFAADLGLDPIVVASHGKHVGVLRK